MDPLSVTMAIVGLMTAAEQLSSTLQPLIKSSMNAPEEINEMKTSVDASRTVLSQLQLMLTGKSRVGRNPCVTTFSDLDVFVETLGTDAKMGLLNRMRWATKTSTIQEHMQKLEVHKSTLTLMMTILTCESMRTAEDAVDMLSSTITQVLESNLLIAQRLASIEVGIGVTMKPLAYAPPTMTGLENVEPVPESYQRDVQGFAFEEELNLSWVYKRSAVRSDDGEFSTISSAGRTASWSMLSGLSLADNITVIAVQALPIYEQDLSNSNIYSFGDFTLSQAQGSTGEATAAESASADSVSSPKGKSIKSWFRRTRPSQSNIPSVKVSEPPAPAIFGIPLRQSITYANVAISLVDAEGRSYIYGYLPIVVAKIGVFLKEKGTTCEDIFARNGSAVRVHELEMIFDTPGPTRRYGKGLDWSEYSVYDAASCFLRYLKRLPEPVIPFEFFDRFTSILGPTLYEQDAEKVHVFSIDEASTIQTLQQYVTEIPPLNRQLLLYLLDISAVFASKSDTNKMTSQRMAAALQPALLAREPKVGMSTVDHMRAAETLEFMIEKQEYILEGMRGAPSVDKQITGTTSNSTKRV